MFFHAHCLLSYECLFSIMPHTKLFIPSLSDTVFIGIAKSIYRLEAEFKKCLVFPAKATTKKKKTFSGAVFFAIQCKQLGC